jgi:hypothetical protein
LFNSYKDNVYHTNFFIENLKSLFNIYNVMALIQDYVHTYSFNVNYDTCISIDINFGSPSNDYYSGTTNILSPLLDILDRIIV